MAILAIAIPPLFWLAGRPFVTPLFGIAVIFLLLSEAERRVLPIISAVRREFVTTGVRLVYALLALAASEAAIYSNYRVGPALLALLVAHSAVTLRRRTPAVVTACASLANIGVWLAHRSDAFGLGSTSGVSSHDLAETLLVSILVLPGMALVLHLRTHRSRATQARLERTVAGLRSAHDELRASQQQLQVWNEQLSMEVQQQTSALDERNQYLSIINAVSFALAEPMDGERSLERAVRLVARLLGVRAAQAYTRPRHGEVVDLFVTVAPEDLHAPRLPESLLRAVAQNGHPVTSTQPDAPHGLELPDLGEAYHVVPLVAKGRVLGSFALIGSGRLRNDDDGRHLLLLVGREMGVALENARLYQEALEKAEREEFLTEVTRLLNGSGRGERALPEVLSALIDHLGAAEALLVSLPEGSRDVVIAGSAVASNGPLCLEELARSLSRIVADRSTPLVLGVGGEAPLSDQLAASGFTTVAASPIFATRGRTSLESSGTGLAGGEAVQAQPVLAGALLVAMGAHAEWGAEHSGLLERVTDTIARRVQADEFVAVQQQRIRELTGLAEVARTMQSGADVERLYNGFASALQRLLSYQALYVARLDESGALVDLPTFAPRGRPTAVPDFSPADAGHPWFTLRSALLWRRGDSDPPAFIPAESRSAVVVPMRPKGQMLGVAVVVVPRPIRDDQMRIVEQAVEQLSLALDGAALYQQATARASHIQALSNLARIVASVVNLREAFSAFSEEVRWLIPFDRTVMFLLDESERTVTPYATYPETAEEYSALPLHSSIASVPIERGTAVTFRRGDPRYAHLDWSLLGPDAQEVAAVPVRQGDHTSAVFALVVNSPGTYTVSELDALDEVAGLLAVTIERLRLYEHADHSAKHDLLTGLPNYRYLQERMQETRAGLDGDDGESALLVVDMDNLKVFNDTLGHEVGDRVIEIVAEVLRASCRQDDFVARTGGDEFVVLMEGAGAQTALAVAERIHAALHEAHSEIEGAPVRVGASIGVALAPHDAATTAGLLHAADQAMYDAKFAGGQRTRMASERGEAAQPRTLRSRTSRLSETLLRTLTAGAGAEELRAVSLAQRWATALGARLDLPVEVLPQLRLVIASESSRRFASPRGDRDQLLARYLVDRILQDWEELGDERGPQLAFLAVTLLEVAWAMIDSRSGVAPDLEGALRLVAETHPTSAAHPLWPVLEDVVRTNTDRRGRRDAA